MDTISTTTDEKAHAIHEWLESFAQAVRNVDFESGRSLCAYHIMGFGTVTPIARNLDELAEQQWKVIWPNTRDFFFDLESGEIRISPDERMATASLWWSSIALDTDGQTVPREGRATVVLTREGEESPWLAVHTHFSMKRGFEDVAVPPAAR